MPEGEYEVELFRKQGFTRQTCAKCGKAFWSIGQHETCGEAPCQEYDFIGNPPFAKKLTYRAMREDFLSYLEQNGHTRVKRYPIVARWRDDVFFVQASVYPFQPWVISGEASPPANPLALSQPCVRFLDVDNVGKTGQHFTMFEMMAHHAFNFPGKFLYFKDHTVELCHGFLTERLGLKPEVPRYKESWWEGGGNSGPCFEVVFGGAEAATLVFMMNRDVNGHRVPMDTTVVDTGYGLERLTWLSQGTTSAYEAVFGDSLAYLKRATGAKRVDDRVLREYSKVAGMLKIESLADIREIRRQTAERVGISVDELVAQISPLESLYIVCDHSRALIFILGDGVVPSNSREGYFARLLVRRGLRALKDLNITYSLADTVSFMIDQMREDYPEFFFNKGDILKLLKVEETRYKETLEKGRATVGRIADELKAAGTGFDVDTLIQLYDSHGLNPDVVREFTDMPVDIPDDFYARVAARHERPTGAEPAKKFAISKTLPPTKLRVYEDKRKRVFRAKVLAVEGEAVVLDQTYFYPEGGGQEADHGTIADREVYDVQKVGPTVLHFVRGDASALVGTRVACAIDGERREALMRNHTATHIVLGAARKALGNHVWQAGAHKGADMARLDITHFDALSDTEVAKIEALANEEVLARRQVRAKFMARDVAERKFGFRLYQGGSVPGGELRVVEIPKWDVEACGGTHVSRTSDVSLIKILRSTRIQDGVVRLEYAAGKGALDAVRKQVDELARVAEILEVPLDHVVPAAERMVAEWKEYRKLSQRATDEQAAAKTRKEIETAKGPWPILRSEVPQGVGFMLSMSKATASESRAVGIYWAPSPSDVKLVLTRGAQVPVDAAELVRSVAPEFHGKGGGKPDFAQASFPNADQARAAAARLEELVRKQLGIESG
ncbi:MAG: alanine--tRNA ligase [Methanobacteriota archaeon]|nr:MAG: alanine--tRNA ligase [Euryarchaeota archaeon]